jgi:hypothetical protein
VVDVIENQQLVFPLQRDLQRARQNIESSLGASDDRRAHITTGTGDARGAKPEIRAAGKLDGEPRLASSHRTANHDDPRSLQGGPELGELGLSADEGRRRGQTKPRKSG